MKKLKCFVSSETESAKGEEPTKDETDEATVDDAEMINNNKEPKKSVGSKMTSLLSAMKKTVTMASRKDKYTEAEGCESEVKLPVSINIGLDNSLLY